MDEKEKYKKLIDAMKRSTPGLSDREQLEEQIMERIGSAGRHYPVSRRAGRILFGWTEIGWIRRSLSTAAAVIIGLFIFQQVNINRRVNRLENRVVTIVSSASGQESGPRTMEKILLNMVTRDPAMVDSIIVSRSDLENLLKSYLELEEEARQLKESLDLEPILKELNNDLNL
jgi:hypothetical protein